MPPIRRSLVIVLAAVAFGALAAYLLVPRLGPGGDQVEAQLQQAAAALGPFPRRIDEATELVEARVENRRMTYVYRLTRAGAVDAAVQAAHLRGTVCQTEAMAEAIRRHGVAFVYEYRSQGDPGQVAARVEVDRCP
jgi:hypothetical protein